MAMVVAVVVLAQPRSHRQQWRSAEARGRKMDEIRERESCASESERERERERERRGGGGESQVERREKTIKKQNTHATVPV